MSRAKEYLNGLKSSRSPLRKGQTSIKPFLKAREAENRKKAKAVEIADKPVNEETYDDARREIVSGG